MSNVVKSLLVAPIDAYTGSEIIMQDGVAFVQYEAFKAKGLLITTEEVPTMADFNDEVNKNTNNTPTVSKFTWSGSQAILAGASFNPFSQSSGVNKTASLADFALDGLLNRIGIKIIAVPNTNNNYLIHATLKLTWSGWQANGQQVQSAYITATNLANSQVEERYRIAVESTGASMQMVNLISHVNGTSDFKITNGFNLGIANSGTSGTLTLTGAELTMYHTILVANTLKSKGKGK